MEGCFIRVVGGAIQFKTEKGQWRTNARADRGGMFADAATENQGVNTAGFGGKSADRGADLLAIIFNRKLGRALAYSASSAATPLSYSSRVMKR